MTRVERLSVPNSLKESEKILDTCKSTRAKTAQALHTSLSQLLSQNNKISEANLRDKWVEELKKETDILPEYWYQPPGIGVLFGTEDNKRLNFDSLRKKDNWPSEDIFLSKEGGVIYTYASPVDKNTYTAGDFGTVLCFGVSEAMKQNLKTSLQISRDIFSKIKIGQTLSHLYQESKKIIQNSNSFNKNSNTTFKAGENIGHTIPQLTEEKISEHKSGRKTLADLISHERFFISTDEDFKIIPGTILTIEPRLIINPNLPMVSCHMICLVHEDHTELLENFDDLFQLTGMDYMFSRRSNI